jgi:hypothetical protein
MLEKILGWCESAYTDLLVLDPRYVDCYMGINEHGMTIRRYAIQEPPPPEPEPDDDDDDSDYDSDTDYDTDYDSDTNYVVRTIWKHTWANNKYWASGVSRVTRGFQVTRGINPFTTCNSFTSSFFTYDLCKPDMEDRCFRVTMFRTMSYRKC